MNIKKFNRFISSHFARQTINRVMAEISPRRLRINYSPCFCIIDVSLACNMRCPFCQTLKYRSDQKLSYLSLVDANIILNKLKNANFVGFCGAGEPFLNKDLFNMIRIAKTMKMAVYVTTNGTLIENRFDEVLSSKIDYLEISLKETNDEKYKKILVDSKFKIDTLINIINRLSDQTSRPRLILSYVLTRSRVESIPEVLEIAYKARVDEVLFQNFIPASEKRNEDECLFEEDKQWVMKYIANTKHSYEATIINGPYFYTRNEFLRKCKTPFKSIRIGVDGGVSGCPRAIDPSITNGNIFLDEDIYNRNHFLLLRKQFIDKHMPLHFECIYCNKRLEEAKT